MAYVPPEVGIDKSPPPPFFFVDIHKEVSYFSFSFGVFFYSDGRLSVLLFFSHEFNWTNSFQFKTKVYIMQDIIHKAWV